MAAEYVYLGRNNTVILQLKTGGLAQDLSAVTRMTLDFDGTIVDSDVSGGAFDWSLGDGKVELALKDESITPGTYGGDDSVDLIVYDPSNTAGIVWGKVPMIVQAKSSG